MSRSEVGLPVEETSFGPIAAAIRTTHPSAIMAFTAIVVVGDGGKLFIHVQSAMPEVIQRHLGAEVAGICEGIKAVVKSALYSEFEVKS